VTTTFAQGRKGMTAMEADGSTAFRETAGGAGLAAFLANHGAFAAVCDNLNLQVD
jgi:hypothetical protein